MPFSTNLSTMYTFLLIQAICEEVNECGGAFAADLVARLLHPKPQQRIATIEKAMQHKYFHEEVVETSRRSRIRGSPKSGKMSAPKDSTPVRRRSLSLRRKK